MKQNERLLIYAVSGFLALILIVAVVFGHNPQVEGGASPAGDGANGKAPAPISGASDSDMSGRAGAGQASPGNGVKSGSGAMDLSEILGARGGNPAVGNLEATAAGERTGVPAPQQVADRSTGGQPLVAVSKPLVAAEVVTQSLGPSRRDRNVRFVRARSGDSLELLVRRWCGARDPFLAEATSLNEDLVTVRVGQEVAVPYVDDEVLMATLEVAKPEKAPVRDPAAANQPAAASAADLVSLLGTGPTPGNATQGNATQGKATQGAATPSTAAPGLRVPGASPVAVEATAGRGTTYTVKSGDSLWKIAERTYGRQRADRMIAAIKGANPGLTDTVRIGQKIVLPKPAE